jgi:hypothetical protein
VSSNSNGPLEKKTFMRLNGYLKKFARSAALLLPAVVCTSASAQTSATAFDRPIHFVYAREGGKAFGNHTDAELKTAFKQVQKGITAYVPFLLNVTDPSDHADMIKWVQEQGAIIVPGIGQEPENSQIDDAKFITMARNTVKYTRWIRLENLQGYYDTSGRQPIQHMINVLVDMGYEHIMMNPWPVGGLDKTPVQFDKEQYLDSTIYQVSLKKTSSGLPDPSGDTNFFPPQGTKISDMFAHKPDIKILINYESAPQHELLTNMERRKTNSSYYEGMQITADKIAQRKDDLHWTPPFTSAYDPLQLKTWNLISARLNKF